MFRVFRGICVYLSYWDDSGSDNRSDLLVVGGVVVSPSGFGMLESAHASAVRRLIPQERIGEFQEFHAFEMMNGQGVFADTLYEDRRKTLAGLLHFLELEGVRYFYSAVDKAALRQRASGSAMPLDVAFRMCLFALQEWLRGDWQLAFATFTRHQEDPPFVALDGLCLVIADDCDRAAKQQLRDSFRQFRARLYEKQPTEVTRVHDAMYFGDSVDSIGLQLADACNYVMRRHLSGLDDHGLFGLLSKVAIGAKPEPDYSMLQSVLRYHDGVDA